MSSSYAIVSIRTWCTSPSETKQTEPMHNIIIYISSLFTLFVFIVSFRLHLSRHNHYTSWNRTNPHTIKIKKQEEGKKKVCP